MAGRGGSQYRPDGNHYRQKSVISVDLPPTIPPPQHIPTRKCLAEGPTVSGPAQYSQYAILFVIGSLLAIFASFCMWGPKNQCKKTWAKERRCTSFVLWVGNQVCRAFSQLPDKVVALALAVFFGLLIAIVALALTHQPIALILIVMVVQVGVGVWWSAAFVPYGRTMVLNCCKMAVEGRGGGVCRSKGAHALDARNSTCFYPCPAALDPCQTYCTNC